LRGEGRGKPAFPVRPERRSANCRVEGPYAVGCFDSALTGDAQHERNM
jgi:hypothetical protein